MNASKNSGPEETAAVIGVKPCLHCRKSCQKGLWCEVCLQRAHITARRTARRSTKERKVYRTLDYPKYLAALRVALERLEKDDESFDSRVPTGEGKPQT